jgi:putative transposase
MEPSKAVKEYKEELIKSQKQNERLTTLVGKVTVEKEWLAKKLKSLGLSNENLNCCLNLLGLYRILVFG